VREIEREDLEKTNSVQRVSKSGFVFHVIQTENGARNGSFVKSGIVSVILIDQVALSLLTSALQSMPIGCDMDNDPFFIPNILFCYGYLI